MTDDYELILHRNDGHKTIIKYYGNAAVVFIDSYIDSEGVEIENSIVVPRSELDYFMKMIKNT